LLSLRIDISMCIQYVIASYHRKLLAVTIDD
jgi:hypothetical protein